MSYSPEEERALRDAWVAATENGAIYYRGAQTVWDAAIAYAATLRQQAARVDEGMVSDAVRYRLLKSDTKLFERYFAADYLESSEIDQRVDEEIGRAALEAALSAQPAFSAPTGDAPQPWTADDHERLDAALTKLRERAQPAERQGEAVAKVRHFDYRGIARNGFSQEAEMLDGAPIVPDETLLYLHPAAPVGVPDGMVLVPREPSAEMLDAAIDAFDGFNGEDEVDAVWAAMLAAAPSAPQGVE